MPLALAALTLLYMAPFIFPPTGREVLDGHDLVDQQYPVLSFIFDSVREGRGLPLWNPYEFAGQSLVSNPQSTLFYPPAWVMVPLGVPRAVGWLVVLHLWIGGWGMGQLARRLGATHWGALAGAVVYEFSALMGAHLDAGHLNYVLCQAWLPWIAASYLWSVASPRWLIASLWGAAALGLCILTGYPPLLYFAGLWLVGLWLYTSLQAPAGERWAAAWRALRPLLVVLIGGAMLGAVLLLPVAQFTLRSTRALSGTLGLSSAFALSGSQLITLVLPNLFGTPRLPGEGYWGVPFYEEVTAYVGILPLVALFLVRRRPAALLMIASVLLGLATSLGVDGGLFPMLYWLLPGYRLFRVPSRALYFVVVGAAGAAALWVTDLQASGSEERAARLRPAVAWALPLLGVLALGTSLAFAAYFTAHSTESPPPWRAQYSSSVAGTAALAIGATWLVVRVWQKVQAREWPSLSPHWALGLTVMVLVLDLWRISETLVNVSTVDVPPTWLTMARVAPAAPDYRVMVVPTDTTMWQAGALYTHHLNAAGYDPLVSEIYQRLLRAIGDNPTSPLARLLGVRYALSAAPITGPGSERLQLVYQGEHEYIYATPDPLPRAFVAPAVAVIPDDAAARRQLASGAMDPAALAIVDHPVGCPQPGGAAAPATSPGAQLVSYSPNAVEVATSAQDAGILVLTDTYDPDWAVTVDGTPAELLRVDTALRGVCVLGGTHRVQFAYHPRLFVAGLWLSGLSWLALGTGGLLAAGVQARRRAARLRPMPEPR